jgi:hypothetical protein
MKLNGEVGSTAGAEEKKMSNWEYRVKKEEKSAVVNR